MPSRKSLLVLYSYHHRNTEIVANVLAEVLAAEIRAPREIKLEELGDYDLIGFGSGIYNEKLHETLLDLADRLPLDTDQKAFIFSTNGAPASLFSESMSWDQMAKNHRLIKEKLQARGYQIAGEFSCPGWNTNRFLRHFGGLNKGRPNAGDLKRAAEFARNLRLEPGPR